MTRALRRRQRFRNGIGGRADHVEHEVGAADFSCWLCDVSVSSGASAQMYTSPATRSSVPAAVIRVPP